MQIFNSKHLILFIFLLTAFSVSAKAQINHFIYLQTDNKQPFYIKYNSKIYSSTSSGYLILSKLVEGVINITIGFPQSQSQEQKFELQIDKIEKGFLLKNFNEKGWGLFDLQSSNVIYSSNAQSQVVSTPNTTGNTQTASDPFANMLSTVTQDSTVKNVTVKKEEKIIVDTPKPVLKTSVLQPVKIDTPKSEPVAETIVTPVVSEPQWTPPAKSEIVKLKTVQSTEGNDIMYEVKNNKGVNDTVRLFIPIDSAIMLTQQQVISESVIKKDTISTAPAVKVEIPAQPEIKKEEPEKKGEQQIINLEKKQDTKTVPNSNCLAQATEDDFIKLRRKMAAQSKDDAMVNEAKKVFKTKCFSTDQLKNLAVLFLSDEWRYRFYDAALPFVSDFSNFKILEETIKEEYYKKRFQALLPNQ